MNVQSKMAFALELINNIYHIEKDWEEVREFGDRVDILSMMEQREDLYKMLSERAASNPNFFPEA